MIVYEVLGACHGTRHEHVLRAALISPAIPPRPFGRLRDVLADAARKAIASGFRM
jgi:hypothetical protein